MPNIDPKQMKSMMKKLGMKQEEIEASEVLIKCRDKELIIRNPQVMKINMMGQDSIQIVGEIEERGLSDIKKEDIDAVVEQTGCNQDEALKALEDNDGDIAKAILSFKE